MYPNMPYVGSQIVTADKSDNSIYTKVCCNSVTRFSKNLLVQKKQEEQLGGVRFME